LLNSAAKNVILAGVKGVTLYDPSPVEVKDLGAQFYLSSEDVGRPTAASCKERLQELNKAVAVAVLDHVSEQVLAEFQASSNPCSSFMLL
jgi:ubiquitin-activating enzyme E1